MYADVIVDISYEKLDRIFQYRIPEYLNSKIEIGSQVEIPFGRGNRSITGYVVGITEQADYPEDKIKELSRMVKGSTGAAGIMIQLAWWMRETYGATMNQALKTVIPVKKQVKGKEKKFIRLNLDPLSANALLTEYQKRSKAKERLLSALLTEEVLPMETVTQKLHVSPDTIKAMEKQGVIRIYAEGIYRNPSVYHKEKVEYALMLTEEQQAVTDCFLRDFQAGVRKTYLLLGVTGSGKTEVYMEMIFGAVSQGKQAIVLIPEIALTYQTVLRFYKRFGDRVSMMNSRMSQGERFDQFERAKKGEIDIMIGPRSALFTPFTNLGLVIIDEEHEGSYKSETLPKYHARETAMELCSLTGASLVLGSATPTVESYYQAQKGSYTLLELKNRVKNRPLPKVTVVDLREELKSGNKSMLSRQLKEQIKTRLEKRQQSMIFINRRGYAGFVSCRTCGKPISCPHCAVSLKAHKDGTLRCHYCGYSIPMPNVCPQCASPYIGAFGTGTQKVEEAIRREFPEARVLRMDMDTTRGKNGHEEILTQFANQEADILVGTQMIVKGHDFPLVTLVGVIAADLSLYEGDYRSSEKTFELLTQAAGRAGRGAFPGEVIIQTYTPDHYSIETAAAQDYLEFYEKELLYRQLLGYPPKGALLAILITSPSESCCEALSNQLAGQAKQTAKACRCTIIGPAWASVSKISDIYRRVLYIKQTEGTDTIHQVKHQLEQYLKENPPQSEAAVQFDYNPVNSY